MQRHGNKRNAKRAVGLDLCLSWCHFLQIEILILWAESYHCESLGVSGLKVKNISCISQFPKTITGKDNSTGETMGTEKVPLVGFLIYYSPNTSL